MEPLKSGAKTIFFLVLVLLGIAGNRWNITLFYGVDFLFGSIASFIILSTLGAVPAILSTLFIGGYTIFLWHHPFSMLTYTGQIVFAIFFLKRARYNLTLVTGIFWLIIGIPTSYFIFLKIFKTPSDAALLVGLKQSINEIFNAVIASLILDHTIFSRLPFLQFNHRRSVFQTIFNVFVAAAIIPSFIILVLDARKSVEQVDTLNRLRLDTLSKSIPFFAAQDAFQQLVTSVTQSKQFYVTLLDRQGIVLNSNRPGVQPKTQLKKLEEDPSVRMKPPNFYQRWPEDRTLNPMVAWGLSSFGIATPVPEKHDWTLQIEIPLADQERVIFHQYVRALTLLLVLVLFILVASQWFANLIGEPLARLSTQTAHIPDQLTTHGQRTFISPHTDFIEIKALIENFKRMDDELKKRFTELERANRMKDEFLATLSHELRTPLNVILGHASLIKQELEESPDQKIPNLDHSIDAITRNASIQNQLVSDLLDISAIITGKISFHPKIISLTELGRSVAESVHLSAEAKGVKLTLELSDSPCTVLGDSTRLNQVIWNLLSNSIKFTQRGGEVVLRIYSKLSDDERCSVIEVDDNGRGIEPEFIPHIFERFRQEDSTTTRKFGGLGLGLSIVRHLVELHGGSVSAASEGKGKGSHFQVVLPFAENAQFTSEEASTIESRTLHEESEAASKIYLNGLHLLVVDDDADSRELISFVLQRAGATVETAETAGRALDLLKTTKYHLIVSDIGLPDEDGYTLIRKLRRDDSSISKLTPAIALTAYAREEDRKRSLESGFQAYLSKPVDVEKLILLIREWNPT